MNRLEEMLEETADCEGDEEDLVWALGCAYWGGVVFEWEIFLGVMY